MNITQKTLTLTLEILEESVSAKLVLAMAVEPRHLAHILLTYLPTLLSLQT